MTASRSQPCGAGPSDYAVPIAPPSASGKGPTFVAHEGRVWRRAMQNWWDIDPPVCVRLLAGFRADAENTDDWFHPQAARLADELERAMREAEQHRSAA